ncbi:hypothetical protein H072_7010 [Dactylellina haptotyla CBS 200.50]|uniref:tRNA/rRNA methyltransferase SpoU type domain-containing protein n=1 Tax=Dactylellina haptotyla (strain CBS 200.50) TaxID=1284197 RepID=S8ADS4_DACHA|nr:hypothetical protein H072_7010 [Dactylellina haptotyla CBS 200.50]
MSDELSTTALLENLQDNSKGLDILAYLLELQLDNKAEISAIDQQVSRLAAQLYNFVFYPKNGSLGLRERLSEVIELLRKHEKLSLRSNILSILIPETILLIRLCILSCKDEYGPRLSEIYSSVPGYPGTLEDQRRNGADISNLKLDAEIEVQNIESAVEEQLRPLLETKSAIFQVTKDRLLFLEDLLSEQNNRLKSFIQDQPTLTPLLTRICVSATYVADQGIILSSVRLLRRINHIHNHLVQNSASRIQEGSDAVIFEHIESLLRSNHKLQINAGYHLWIGFLESYSEKFDLNAIIRSESYWEYILNGLATSSGEIKKISLHILWSTVQQLTESLELSTFTWDIKARTSLLDFWKTYITFTEMIALDNSVAQLRLAFSELEKLVQRALAMAVPGDWILVLFSQGFGESSTGDMSLRISEFILKLDDSALWWTQENKVSATRSPLDFFRATLFPQVFRTPNFNVSVLTPDYCEHGTAISEFVKKILSNSLYSGDTFQKVIEVLLNTVIDHVGQSNAGQFYVLKGIIDSTNGQENCLASHHSDLLVKIANLPLDNILRSEMKTSMCLILCLRLEQSERMNTQDHLELVAQILRTNPAVLDEKFLQLIKSELELDSFQISGIIENGLGSPTNVDIGLYSLMIALSIETPSASSLLRYYSNNSSDINNRALIQLLRYGVRIIETLQLIPEVRDSVAGTFQQIFDQGTHIHHDPDIACLIPLLDPKEKMSVRQSAMAVLQDISENWTAGFSNIDELLATLRFYLRLCIFSKRGDRIMECPESLINAIVARTVSFCEEVYDKIKRKKYDYIGNHSQRYPANEIAHTRDFHEVIVYFLELIQVMLYTREKLPVDLGYYVLITLHNSVLPYVDGAGYTVILDCIEHILAASPASLQMVDDLNELLQEWGIKAEEDRLGRNQQSNQVKAIGIILHPAILDASVATGPTLIKICKDIQKNMSKRRGLAPALARALCRAFDVTPATFCREHGFTEVLHEFLVPTGPKKEDNNFDVEDALGVLFDEINGSQGSYEKYHGEKEKIAQARIFDVLARFDFDDAIQELWAKTLLDEVFEPWTEIDPRDPGSLRIVQKWKKTQQLQTVLLLERFITDDDADDHLEAIFTALSREANPRYKFLLEWMAFRCILRFPNLRNVVWERFQTTEDDIPSYTVSLLRLAHLISKHIKDDHQEEFFTELVTKALPCATSNKVTIRHEGAELIPQLYEEATEFGYTKLTENPIFRSIYDFVVESAYRKVMIPSPTADFDPIEDFTLVGVLAGPYIMCDGGGDIIPLFYEEDFSAFPAENGNHFVSIGCDPPATSATANRNQKNTDKKQEAESTAVGPIQTKGGDWDIKNLLERQDAQQGRFTTRRQSHDIEVVASLVDNNFNLGGLCRVCELSGVKTLYVNHKVNALKSKEFISVSVSAENWLPIEETKKPDIANLLARKRQEGYTIVGIEQTDRSITLGSNDFAFPGKTVLLIGAEKTGIPPELLAEMDICVEIKQFGETRSMNVQTAAAVVLYEYTRQNGGIQ